MKNSGSYNCLKEITKNACGEKRKAFFLDRDGTVNKHIGFITRIEELELLEGVGESIKLLNEEGYMVIIITNQSGIARGYLSVEELEEIHNKMKMLLQQEGAYVDDIFYCPHYIDKEIIGGRKEFQKECSCRKPKPGMLIEAAGKYNIDLKKSWMIGDSKCDVEAGKRAGCQIALIGQVEDKEIPCFSSLFECVNSILESLKERTCY